MKRFTAKKAWRPAGDFLMDCRLQRTWNNDYYLCIPMAGAFSVEKQDQGLLRVCSLDPGVRTFQTVYDATNGEALQVGDGHMKPIFRLCKALDVLLSKVAKARHVKEPFSYRRASRRRNLVMEVHCQLAKHLAQKYDVVMIPLFEVSQMVRRGERKIGSKTARQMACWGHDRFGQPLIHKCVESMALRWW